MSNRVIVSIHDKGTGKTKEESFTPKQAERIMSLLEVAGQSTENETDAALLDRLSTIINIK